MSNPNSHDGAEETLLEGAQEQEQGKAEAACGSDDSDLQGSIQGIGWDPEDIQDRYPLTPLQEGILLEHLRDEGDDTYILTTLLELEGAGRVPALTAALEQVIARHAVLRTSFQWEGLSRPVQLVHRKVTLPRQHWVLADGTDPLEQLRAAMRPAGRPLDPATAPLIQLLTASQADSGRTFAMLRVHHLICDHQSLRRLLEETLAFLQGDGEKLPVPPVYKAHVLRGLRSGAAEADAAFFRSHLADLGEPAVPFGLAESHGAADAVELRWEVNPPLGQQVREVARECGVSPARLFHAAWALVVAHTSGREDVVFGTVLLDRRSHPEGGLGMAVNTLPLRVKLAGVGAGALVRQVDEALRALLEHSHVPLATAQRASGLPGAARLFTSLFNFRRSPPLQGPGIHDRSGVRVLHREEASTGYPLAVIVDDTGESFELIAQLDRRLRERPVLAQLCTVLASLVAALRDAPDTPALELGILPPAEYQQVIHTFNGTATDYPREQSLHRLFEAQVARNGEALAVVHEEVRLTYAQLNRRANQLARHLEVQGIRPGEYVPLILPRSPDLLIAQLAVLKVGAAYIPLDPDFPLQRLQFTVQDCGARLVLCGEEVPGEIAAVARCVGVGQWKAAATAFSSENLAWDGEGGAAANVMYTSGSTGTPKGVIVPHRGISRLVFNCGYASFGAGDAISFASNPAFDAATFEVFCALLSGARLVIVSQQTLLDPARLASVIEREGVTFMFLTVGLMTQYAESLRSTLGRLRYLFTGGDVVDPNLVQRIMARHAPQHFINAYGPTECSAITTTHDVTGPLPPIPRLPIGRPISNTRVYILDARLRPVPVGVMGEIYISGDGVGLGYLNRPELTAQRFLPDPFVDDPDARMYRSGDLGCWREDGSIDFFGRNDQQVKLRGFRIELGEIESHLSSHPHVKEVAVMVRSDASGQKRLLACFVPREAVTVQARELRAHLQARLPEHMVPSVFVSLERLPLNSSGKVDRKALLALSADALPLEDEGQEPQGPTEQGLATLWRELLDIPSVSRDRSFFDVGGHSLLATQLVARIREHFHVELPVRAIFETPVLKELARRIETRRAEFASLEAAYLERAARLQQDIDEMSDEEVLAALARIEAGVAAGPGFGGRL